VSKFWYKVTKIDNEHQEIKFISHWSRLTLSDQFCIALIIGQGKYNTIDSRWYAGNVIVKSCFVGNYDAEDIVKILSKYK
jgi:hypothetical protein